MRRGELDLEAAEMLAEPRVPVGGDGVADLHHRALAPAGAALDDAEMPAVLARQHGQDGVALAMPPRRQYEALILPIHRARRCPVRGVKSSPIASAECSPGKAA